ncbi:MAG: VIT1/CCC1 transporter family protein [Phyllobacteriaceae bacterium]|nr:VIT1/CCC1 transporter family protein [Phyllobacteriaceae bacterium]
MPLEHSHRADAIAARLAAGRQTSYLRDFVYGGIDGAVTTFAVVSGVVGASLSSNVILILGVANLVADGFSMAASNYSGAKTVADDVERIRAIERKHIRLEPEGEREEVRQILAAKGLAGDSLEEAVAAVTAKEATWIDLMLTDEYGLSPNYSSPVTAALATFAAFVLCGAVPLIPFVLGLESAFEWSALMVAVVFFAIGAAKSRWSLSPWWRSGIETLLIGGAASAMAYAVGYLLRGWAV